jgi:hypothetical protein
MKENGRRSGNNVRNKRAEERRETDGRENRHDCFVLRSPLFIVGVYVTLYFVDWERIQGLDPLIS